MVQLWYRGSVGFDEKRLVAVKDFLYLGHGLVRHCLALEGGGDGEREREREREKFSIIQ